MEPRGDTHSGTAGVACDVSIVMPCLNEEVTLPYCIANAQEALDIIRRRLGLAGEIVIADNGSADRSREIAITLGARVVPVAQRGYGNALVNGFLGAQGRYLVMGDADGSYDFREALPMVEALHNGDDFCMGSRFKGRIVPGAMPFKNRFLGNPLLSGILNLLFKSRVSDAHCGMRAITREAFERLQLSAEGMEFASEMIIKATLLELKKSEVPITLHPDRRDRLPHLRPWRDGWRHLRYMLMLAPGWLFLVPAAILGVTSLGIAVPDLLFSNEEGLWLIFGTHWLIMACTGAILSHALFLFGMAGIVYGIRSGYRRPVRRYERLARLWSLEVALLLGLILLLLGVFGMTLVGIRWIEVSFGPPHQIRQLVVSCSLFVIGIQHIFGGFMLSIIGGNRARFLTSDQ